MRQLVFISIATVAALVIVTASTASTGAKDPRVPALQQRVANLEHQLAFVAATEKCDNVWNLTLNIGVSNIVSAMLGVPGYTGQMPSSGGACDAIGFHDPSPLTRSFQAARTPFGSFLFNLSQAVGALR